MNRTLGWYLAPAWAQKLIGSLTIVALTLWAIGPLQFANAAVENPPLTNSCGLDIALVLDTSTSIDSTELGQMKTAFHGFVDALNPVTPTWFSVTYFSTLGHVNQAFTSSASTANTAIDTVVAGGNTNWEDGLLKAQSTFSPEPRAGAANVIVFASDGQPNRVGTSGTSASTAAAVAAAVAQADLIKASGTRIITLGIGIGSGSSGAANIANMKAISSDDAYYDASSFSTLSSALQTIATDLCGGHISVKKIIDRDGNPATTGDQTPGEGWDFSVAGNSKTTDAFGNTVPVDVSSVGPWTVTETPQSNYTLVGASCTGATNNGTSIENGVGGIMVDQNNIVSCTFYNQPAGGTLHVVKVLDSSTSATVNDFHFNVTDQLGTSSPVTVSGSPFTTSADTVVAIDGASHYFVTETDPGAFAVSYDNCSADMPADGTKTCTITNKDIPAEQGSVTVLKDVVNNNGGTKHEADFVLMLNGDPVVSGDANIVAPGEYTVSEGDHAGYAQTSLVCMDGDVTLDNPFTLAAGQSVTCTVTNDDIAPSLTLVKYVSGSDVSPSSWTLTATGDQVQPVIISGQGGAVSDSSFQAGTYALSESGGPDGYSAGSWMCQTDSVPVPMTSVTLAVGQSATCSITNTFVPTSGADLSVEKTVSDSTPDDNQQITYTVTVHNAGPDTATNVVVSDVLPGGLSYVSDDGAGAYDHTSTSGDWSIDSLADGADAVLHIVVKIGNDSSGDVIVNTATITDSDSADSNSENNSKSVSLTVNEPDNGDTCPNLDGIQPAGTNCQTGGHDGNNGGGGGGGGGGGIIYNNNGGGGGGGGPILQGQVLGASCGLYMDKHLRRGSSKNDKDQTIKLQQFLNKYGFGSFTPTGFFGPLTEAATKAFQAKYVDEILKPWGLNSPTGLVYLSTLTQINKIECPDLLLTLPELVPWSANPNAQ